MEWFMNATELAEDQRFCTCCERPLKGRIRMLELDQRINGFHGFGGVPEINSQGCFPFGLTCAKKKIAEAKKLLAELEA